MWGGESIGVGRRAYGRAEGRPAQVWIRITMLQYKPEVQLKFAMKHGAVIVGGVDDEHTCDRTCATRAERGVLLVRVMHLIKRRAKWQRG